MNAFEFVNEVFQLEFFAIMYTVFMCVMFMDLVLEQEKKVGGKVKSWGGLLCMLRCYKCNIFVMGFL